MRLGSATVLVGILGLALLVARCAPRSSPRPHTWWPARAWASPTPGPAWRCWPTRETQADSTPAALTIADALGREQRPLPPGAVFAAVERTCCGPLRGWRLACRVLRRTSRSRHLRTHTCGVNHLRTQRQTQHPRRSYGWSSGCGPFEQAVEVAGDVVGQAAFDLAAVLPSVDLAVAVSVEPIAVGDLTTVRRNGCSAGERPASGLGVDAAGVGPRAQHRGRDDGSDAELLG